MPYHWVYFADSDVVINRLAEFKNFSEQDAPKDQTVIVAEVTVEVDDPEEQVILALERFGLLDRTKVRDTLTLSERYGYPVYDRNFERAREESAAVFGSVENLHLVGRNSEFRHNEVDENFASAMRLVEQLASNQGTKPQPLAAAGAH
jgi:UDP-galactopyranose mutase